MLGSVVLEASPKPHVVVVEVLEEICDLSRLVSDFDIISYLRDLMF